MEEDYSAYFEGLYYSRLKERWANKEWANSWQYKRICEEQAAELEAHRERIRREEIEKAKAKLPKVGTKIRILRMVDHPHYTGREGIITDIGDDLQFEGTWGIATVIPNIDKYEIVE